MQIWNILRLAFRLLVTMIMGFQLFMIGAEKADAYLRGNSIEWDLIPLPEGARADRFVIGVGARVYIETSLGDLLASEVVTTEWNEVVSAERDENQSNFEYGFCSHQISLTDHPIQNPPGVVKEQIDCHFYPNPETRGISRYVLLEEGSVWRWQRISRFEGILTIPLAYVLYGGGYALAGAFAGFIISTILVWLIERFLFGY